MGRSFGIPIGRRVGLIDLAKRRLPQYVDNFFTGNALTWVPPRRFDFVRTELVYVPAEYERRYLDLILNNHLKPGGKLLVANYGEGLTIRDIKRGILEGSHATSDILQRLEELGFDASEYKDGYDPVKGRRIRVAIIGAPGRPAIYS